MSAVLHYLPTNQSMNSVNIVPMTRPRKTDAMSIVMVIMLVLLNRRTKYQLSVVLTIRYINENVQFLSAWSYNVEIAVFV